MTALVGPSGAGKTTILNMIAGIMKPDAGRIAVSGRVLFDHALGLDEPPERRHCGYVFQDGRLFPHLSVRRNLLYGHRLSGNRARWMGFEDVLALLNIEHLLQRYPDTLSGGEARRIAIGRALLSAPEFLLLDEPLTSLDKALREGMLETILSIRDRCRLPILYVSHQQEEVERLAADIVRLDDS